MQNISKTMKAFAGDPDHLIVEMRGATCAGVGYEQGADLLKDNTTGCTSVPSGIRLSGVKLMLHRPQHRGLLFR